MSVRAFRVLTNNALVALFKAVEATGAGMVAPVHMKEARSSIERLSDLLADAERDGLDK